MTVGTSFLMLIFAQTPNELRGHRLEKLNTTRCRGSTVLSWGEDTDAKPEDQRCQIKPSCPQGRCDQRGAWRPTCCGGGCLQSGAKWPSCKPSQKGGTVILTCDQSESTGPSCEGSNPIKERRRFADAVGSAQARKVGCDQWASIRPSCSFGNCDQSGSEGPTCAGGWCGQEDAKNPMCSSGCSQVGAEDAKCDVRCFSEYGERLKQTCPTGGCYQHGLEKPTCDGGGCDQSGSKGASCKGGECDQSSSEDAVCEKGLCDQSSSKGAKCSGKGECDREDAEKEDCKNCFSDEKDEEEGCKNMELK
eukprot:TRINITY_DN16822_c0_g1_i2.p1 TRINITY_DN16822_c0_g1~~TRINITY_DN16822_c0_g1_i2.p1  ORF type:complete len:305 (-),score=25.07 TRINITY_DN16822_c0_g1_i2:158-1072(-)